ncbi:MAG: thiamine pyrophosphate-binding protein, partial [Thermoleophilaceae bacterium]
MSAHGVSKLFTLSGGHLFSIYDGCREQGIDIVDTRHEQSAAFAAEGWAKATREIGVCALTAGPGVTNGLSAVASAQANSSPVLVLGGRAPAGRWGQGSLQEIDHVPVVRQLTKLARTASSPDEIPALIDEAVRTALTPPTGPVFLDFPLDHVFSELSASDGLDDVPAAPEPPAAPDSSELDRAAELLRTSERPVVMAGSGLYWARGEEALRRLCDEVEVPVFLNGLARGCVPADHPAFYSRARGKALREADVALVIGVPMDFRLGFGQSFGEETEVVLLGSSAPENRPPRAVAAELWGSVPDSLEHLREGVAGKVDHSRWLSELTAEENGRRVAEDEERSDGRAPLHPMRIYQELGTMLTRDAMVIGDGGDFVSYAGRVVESYSPGCWMDPGPYGCLGAGPG